jgi:hypothetical protein
MLPSKQHHQSKHAGTSLAEVLQCLYARFWSIDVTARYKLLKYWHPD